MDCHPVPPYLSAKFNGARWQHKGMMSSCVTADWCVMDTRHECSMFIVEDDFRANVHCTNFLTSPMMCQAFACWEAFFSIYPQAEVETSTALTFGSSGVACRHSLSAVLHCLPQFWLKLRYISKQLQYCLSPPLHVIIYPNI